MPSNKQRDLLKQQKVERTGKSEVIHYTVSISPSIQKDGTVLYRILKLGFTILDNRASIISTEEVATTTSEASAFNKFQVEIVKCGTLDIRELRKLVKELKEEYEKETTKQSVD